MSKFYTRISLLIIVALYFFSILPVRATDKPKLRKYSGIGSAYGFVLDAKSGEYLPGANISLSVPADMEPVKQSASTTSDTGYYQIKAPLGQSKTHFAVDRILDVSILGALFGGAKQVDRILSATQFRITASKPGYKTFYGVVSIEFADSSSYQVRLSPVFLMPETEPYVSYTDPHQVLGKIDKIELSSRLVAPDEVIHFAVTATKIPLRPSARVNLDCFGSKGGYKEIVQRNPHSEIIFRSDYRIDKHNYSRPGVYVLIWYLVNNDYEPVSCERKETLFVVGSEPGKQQEISRLLTEFDAGDFAPADSPFSDHDSTIVPVRVSVEFLRRFVALLPANADFTSLRVVSAPKEAALTAPRMKQPDIEKISSLRSLMGNVNADPKTRTAAQINLAGLYYDEGNFGRAYACYASLSQSPDFSKRQEFYPFHNYAALLLQQGKHEEAARYFSLAVGNARNSTEDHSKAAETTTLGGTSYTSYTSAKNTVVNGFAYPEAVSDMLILENDTDAPVSTDNWLTFTILGKALNDIGLSAKACELLKQVVQVQPHEPQALFALASAETSVGDYDAALETVQQGLSLNPHDQDALVLKQKLNAEVLAHRLVLIANTVASKHTALGAPAKHSKPKQGKR